MWKCPRCERVFGSANQSHMCVVKDIGELFDGKPDDLILAFDAVLQAVMQWEPNSLGPSVNTIIFANQRTWLVIRPMAKALDIKFYLDRQLESPYLFKVTEYRKKFAHHIRVANETEVTPEVVDLLRHGYDYAMR